MAFKAKKGHKRTELWVWPLPKTSIELLRPVADRESAIIWDFRPFIFLLTKARQSDVTEFQGKSDIPKDFENIFHICTVGLWSPSSALQVGMVKNVKFDHDFATFFGMFLLKYYTVKCSLKILKFLVLKIKFLRI